MKQHVALIVASTVTAFTLVVVGGVAARVAQSSSAAQPADVSQPSSSAPTAAPITSPTADTTDQTAYIQQVNAYYQARDAAYQQQAAADQQHEAVYQQRELAYQQLIKQANQQLQQAYNQLAASKKPVRVRVQTAQSVQQSAPQNPAPTQPAPTATPYAISPQNAAAIALAAAPGTNLLATPDLVDFQGAVAYEVLLDRGNVYVDANTGQVLYNGVPAPVHHTSNASQGTNPNPTVKPKGGGDDGGGDHGGGGSGGGDDGN